MPHAVLLILPVVFLADYIFNSVLAAFVRPAKGRVSADSRMIYSYHVFFSRRPLVCRLLFAARHKEICLWLAINQTLNFLFLLIYVIVCVIDIAFAERYAVLLASIHFGTLLLAGLVLAIEHLYALKKHGQI